jgi:hypothetical protein
MYWVVLGVVAAVAAYGLATSQPLRVARTGIAAHYPAIHAAAFLTTFTMLWATALPDLLDADHGTTPIGNPLYAALCAAICTWVVHRGRSRRVAPRPAVHEEASAGAR